MGRPPKLDPKKQLTADQKAILVGGLLGDCWIELQVGAKNARIGLQLATKDSGYFIEWCQTFSDWLEDKAKITVMKAYETGEYKPQLTARTLSHPEFTSLFEVFRPGGVQKLVPSVSWLQTQFTELSFAQLFMQDGSRHGIKAAPGFDIHTQGFTFESSARLCFLLHEKFGVDAWLTRDIKLDATTKEVRKVYWNIYISSDSYAKVVTLLQTNMNQDMVARKFHPVPIGERPRNPKNKVGIFNEMFAANVNLREDIYYALPEELIQEYAIKICANPNKKPIIKPPVLKEV
jgi:hypothetical protein